ncbi:MAG TPA: VWA domain-containing protein [Gammaproteobacteria bacterium]|nr:VWA domain-containing protein [Gammaproteobacteria bacterium]
MRKRRDMETFNLSFLDVVCCGFGAVILLLVITKIYEPVTIQKSQEELQKLIVTLEQELNLIRGESTVLNQTLTEVREQLSENDEQKNRLTGDLSELQGEFTASKALADEKTAEMNGLLSAKQSMTEIMRRLLKDYRPKDETTVGGIPVDSEYIIFVIDTSGSMYQGPWNLVIQKITETLAVYPKLKGIQVLNDEGEYMFSSYAGRWIPDSPSIRKNITSRLQYWNPYSDSSPVEGITEAINTFYDRDKQISIYVFGDDFPRGSVEAVCRYVARINKADRFGNRLVRIHGIGFPTQIGTANGAKFAHLMRKLSEQNGGTFVALPHL